VKRGGPLKRNPEKAREWQQRSAKKAAENAKKKPRKAMSRKRKNPYAKKQLKGKAIDIANSQAFRLAAVDQGYCGNCGVPYTGQDFDAHHVIEKRYLKANGLDLFNTDNALLLCEECHRGQTNRLRPLPLECLTDANIQYAFYLLKGYADTYLRRLYTGDDPRVTRALAELEQAERCRTKRSPP